MASKPYTSNCYNFESNHIPPNTSADSSLNTTRCARIASLTLPSWHNFTTPLSPSLSNAPMRQKWPGKLVRLHNWNKDMMKRSSYDRLPPRPLACIIIMPNHRTTLLSITLINLNGSTPFIHGRIHPLRQRRLLRRIRSFMAFKDSTVCPKKLYLNM